ncbi:MAG: DUF2953 domain-containing protein [Oscillospiraceae bacterium]|jgi:hypothetical protein|nr:DUF2953 domain-containing protein [Oscillospiraceae bacterium]
MLFLVLGIILVVLILLAFLRVGVIVVYNEDGINVWEKVGFIKFQIKTDKKKKRVKKIKKKGKSVKPGNLKDFMTILKSVKNALDRLRKKLLIKKLTLHYTSAGENAAKTAIGYGAANAAFGIIVPIFEKYFHIKKRDILVLADFESDLNEHKIYAEVQISIAIWEVIYVISALLPILKSLHSTDDKQKTQKMEEKD